MKIGIVGLGLIGASLAGDLRQLGHQVIGTSRQLATCELAVERGLVDQAGTDLKILAAAEAVIICTPIANIVPTVEQLAGFLAPATLVTDAGSVKGSIVTAATKIWPHFVGGHPMAGKTESGIEAAELGMFRDQPYVITPIAETVKSSIDQLASLVAALGARLYHATPAEHDRAVAWISHLPVMVSGSLISACVANGEPAVLQLAKSLASSGFKDTSRVGGGNPELGLMMAKYNRAEILRALQGYQQDLAATVSAIEREDWDGLQLKLEQNQGARPDFLPGQLPTQPASP
jgi:arogenate dehydrogenase (NADP+)